MLDILLDALIDTLKTLPFLFGAYLLIEFLEHRASEKLTGALRRLGPFGPVGGAVLGLVPSAAFPWQRPISTRGGSSPGTDGGVPGHQRRGPAHPGLPAGALPDLLLLLG